MDKDLESTKAALMDYILSDAYIHLFERAILSRFSTSYMNEDKHTKVLELIKTYKIKKELSDERRL